MRRRQRPAAGNGGNDEFDMSTARRRAGNDTNRRGAVLRYARLRRLRKGAIRVTFSGPATPGSSRGAATRSGKRGVFYTSNVSSAGFQRFARELHRNDYVDGQRRPTPQRLERQMTRWSAARARHVPVQRRSGLGKCRHHRRLRFGTDQLMLATFFLATSARPATSRQTMRVSTPQQERRKARRG